MYVCNQWNLVESDFYEMKIYDRWAQFGKFVRKHAIESPTKYVMWYPGFTFRTNKMIHKFVVATQHFLPAFVMDLVLRCKGGQPRLE